MKRFCVILSTLAMALPLVLVISANGFAAEFTIKLHYEMPTTAPLAKYGFEPWAKDLEKATNGRVKVQTYPGDTLFKTKTDAVEAIKAGIADIGFMFAWAFSPQFDLTDVLSVPFIAPNAEVASRATWAVYQKFPEMQEQWKDVKLLAVWTTDPYIFITTKKTNQNAGRFQRDEDANDRWGGHRDDEAPGGCSHDYPYAAELRESTKRSDRRDGITRRSNSGVPVLRSGQVLHHGPFHLGHPGVDHEQKILGAPSQGYPGCHYEPVR